MDKEDVKYKDEAEGTEPANDAPFRKFAGLVILLGTSAGTNDKLDALAAYFATADDRDKVWVIALFSGRKPKRAVNSTQLFTWCNELTGLPQWLFEESYHTVGDLAETIALLLPDPLSASAPEQGLSYYLEKLMQIGKAEESVKKKFILDCWDQMDKDERFVFNKLITGGFRIGVSQKLMVNALARTVSTEPAVIAHRISGNWDPVSLSFAELLSAEAAGNDLSRPYPFYLAYALDEEPAALGDPAAWQAEWKWDGIRGQLIKRGNTLFVWSRGEELMTEKFPEYQAFADLLPDGVVLDGEIIGLGNRPHIQELPERKENAVEDAAWRIEGDAGEFTQLAEGEADPKRHAEGLGFRPLPFAALQTRIGRKNLGKKQLNEVPVGFIAYDLLEFEGSDLRTTPLSERRARLEKIIGEARHPLLQLSPVIAFTNWEELIAARTRARENGSEGIMLKRKSSIYLVGRKRGDWWKWKIDPLVIDAVMVYAQKGHGRRSNLYTDYTFAVRDGEKLLTFTKAYSGLTDKEIAEVDAFVKRNSLEKFGPVRTVKPELVFEIAFEGIAASARHKSGVALRFPRINRWRKDKPPQEINTLEDLKKMLLTAQNQGRNLAGTAGDL
jgi:DNA ligase-1